MRVSATPRDRVIGRLGIVGLCRTYPFALLPLRPNHVYVWYFQVWCIVVQIVSRCLFFALTFRFALFLTRSHIRVFLSACYAGIVSVIALAHSIAVTRPKHSDRVLFFRQLSCPDFVKWPRTCRVFAFSPPIKLALFCSPQKTLWCSSRGPYLPLFLHYVGHRCSWRRCICLCGCCGIVDLPPPPPDFGTTYATGVY